MTGGGVPSFVVGNDYTAYAQCAGSSPAITTYAQFIPDNFTVAVIFGVKYSGNSQYFI